MAANTERKSYSQSLVVVGWYFIILLIENDWCGWEWWVMSQRSKRSKRSLLISVRFLLNSEERAAPVEQRRTLVCFFVRRKLVEFRDRVDKNCRQQPGMLDWYLKLPLKAHFSCFLAFPPQIASISLTKYHLPLFITHYNSNQSN